MSLPESDSPGSILRKPSGRSPFRDGRQVASGDSKGTIKLWDAASGDELEKVRVHEESVSALAFSEDGHRIVSASADGTVRISRLGNAPQFWGLKEHPDHVIELAFSTDGRRLITRSQNDTTWLWDAIEGNPVACLFRSTFVVLLGGSARTSLFADKNRVVSLVHGGVWDATDGRVVKEPESCSPRFRLGTQLLFSPDGRRVALLRNGSCSLALAFTDCINDTHLLQGHTAPVTGVAFSPDGERVATGSEDGTVRVWNATTCAELARFDGHQAPVSCVAFSGDGLRIASGGTDRTIRVWSVNDASKAPTTSLHVVDPGIWRRGCSRENGLWEDHAVCQLAFSADGRVVFSLSRTASFGSLDSDSAVRAWDVETGRCLEKLTGVCDFKAVASGSGYRAIIHEGEFAIQSEERGQVIARFPTVFPFLKTHPSGQIWAGAISNHLYLLKLEGSA